MALGGMLRENLFTRERGDFLQQLVVGGTYFSWLLFFSEGLLRWKEGVGEEDAGGRRWLRRCGFLRGALKNLNTPGPAW